MALIGSSDSSDTEPEESIDVEVRNKSSYALNIKIRTTGNWKEHTLDPGQSINFTVPKTGDCTTVYYWYQSGGRDTSGVSTGSGSRKVRYSFYFAVHDDAVFYPCIMVWLSLSEC
jgi:hypothetical protein